MNRLIDAMSGHYIVCGVGQAGLAVLQELTATRRPVVVIEGDESNAERLEADYPDVPLLRGDFTDDGVLLRAGVARAAGIVLCVDSDKDSLVGTQGGATPFQTPTPSRASAAATSSRTP